MDISTTVRFSVNSWDSNLELFVSNLIAAIQVYERELGKLWNALFNCHNNFNIHFDVRIVYIVEPDVIIIVEARFCIESWLKYHGLITLVKG